MFTTKTNGRRLTTANGNLGESAEIYRYFSLSTRFPQTSPGLAVKRFTKAASSRTVRTTCLRQLWRTPVNATARTDYGRITAVDHPSPPTPTRFPTVKTWHRVTALLFSGDIFRPRGNSVKTADRINSRMLNKDGNQVHRTGDGGRSSRAT